MTETAAGAPDNRNRVKYSIVVPVYKNEGSLPDVIARLEDMQTRLNGTLEVVFVVDGSPDRSLSLLRRLLPQAKVQSQLLAHSRNFGSFPAIKAGFSASRGDYVAAMAADLQEPSELIEDFFVALESGDYDVAVGSRISRDDPKASRMFSNTYWNSYRKLVQPDMPAGGVDIFATTQTVAQKLVSLDESNSSLVGLLFWLGYRRIEIPYSRQERVHGKSAWSMKKKVSYLLDSVFSFTSMPINMILGVGVSGVLLSVAAAIWVFIAWLLGNVDVPGYSALMLVQLFTAASLLFAIGIIGTYVWRTYENTKQRPSSVIMSAEKFGEH